MKVFYSEAHRGHEPPFEIFDGGIKEPVFEHPGRMDRVLSALGKTGWAEILPPGDDGLDPILAVHAGDYVDYLSTAFERWIEEGGEVKGLAQAETPVVIPATFPPRRSRGRPASITGQSGYYTMDLSAPIVAGTYQAAYQAAQCAVSAAEALSAAGAGGGERAVFALCRPPGHHAGRDYCGGYCYFNNASIAARRLSSSHRVAILDVDYHAANGTQDIFYESAEVLTLSIHADPAHHYPSFAGYADETGAGAGLGFHRNFPLPAGTGDSGYLTALDQALEQVARFNPSALVLSAGMDIYAGDPLGDFEVTSDAIRAIGRSIAGLHLPTVVCMEGGYNTEALGDNMVGLLSAFV
jgi:acetoin utilization deacetylase AcuC-like enzyme